MENTTLQAGVLTQQAAFISPEAFLKHWQGHRRVTRRMIEAFPEDKLFTYSVGGMRPFGELIMEMLRMTAPPIRGVVTGKWETFEQLVEIYKTPGSRKELLRMWDEATEQLNEFWSQIPAHRFAEVDTFFGMYTAPVY